MVYSPLHWRNWNQYNAKIPFDPWAAGTPLKNNYQPNLFFECRLMMPRLALFLLRKLSNVALKQLAFCLKRPAGVVQMKKPESRQFKRYNHCKNREISLGDRQFAFALDRLIKANVEAIIFVGNTLEGATLVKQLASMPLKKPLPILSHWGITAFSRAHRDLKN